MSAGPDPLVVDFPTLFVAIDWAERHCVIPDGFRAGQPFLFLGWQSWCLANFYRVRPDAKWVPDDPVKAPAFHFRRSQVVLPQKAGKAPYTAAHICVEGVGPALFGGWARGDEAWVCADHGCECGWEYEYAAGEPMGIPWPTPLIQITAFSEEQTDNVYDALRPMIDKGPLHELIPKTGQEFIRLPNDGRIDVVTSSAQSRLGQRVTFVPQDETGIWTKTNKMTDVATTQRRGLAGMGGRSEETTNAWNPAENSQAQQTAESTRPDIFRYHPQAPATWSYRDKRERRKIHRWVYGDSLREHGGHIDLDSIEAEAAELLEVDPVEAERFFGNRCKSGGSTWLRDGLWGDRAQPIVVPDGTPVCLGFDGSESDDWTAIRAETRDGYSFTPTYGPDELPTIWNPAEHGGTIPHGEVLAAFDELFGRYRVVRAYCDPRDWRTDIEHLQLTYGARRVIVWETNRIAQMHESLKRFVVDIGKVITHDGCKITTTHVGNARKVPKPGQRYILGKPSQHQKIDACMATVLAHEARCDAIAAKQMNQSQSRRRVVVSSR